MLPIDELTIHPALLCPGFKGTRREKIWDLTKFGGKRHKRGVRNSENKDGGIAWSF